MNRKVNHKLVQWFIDVAHGRTSVVEPPSAIIPSGFQAAYVKNVDGSLGEKWTLVTCGKDCYISTGCKNCPARRIAGYVQCLPSRLLVPLKWKIPRVIFACNEGDLFHRSVSDEFIAMALAVMESCPHHRFILLTKRAERMGSLLSDPRFLLMVSELGYQLLGDSYQNWGTHFGFNILAGVSVEDQDHVHRASILPSLPEAMTKTIFVAPQITHVDLHRFLRATGWVVSGGERGCKNPRPCPLEWQLDLDHQCKRAKVPFFLLRRHDPAWVKKAGGPRLEYPAILGASRS